MFVAKSLATLVFMTMRCLEGRRPAQDLIYSQPILVVHKQESILLATQAVGLVSGELQLLEAVMQPRQQELKMELFFKSMMGRIGQ